MYYDGQFICYFMYRDMSILYCCVIASEIQKKKNNNMKFMTSGNRSFNTKLVKLKKIFNLRTIFKYNSINYLSFSIVFS